MAGGRLLQAVRSDLEREPADERSARSEAELPEPHKREEPCADEAEQHEHVPADDEPERAPQRPEGKAERPRRRVQLRIRLGAEGVRIPPRVAAVLQLVAGQPEPVRSLQMVAGRHLAVTALAAGQEVRARVRKRRCRRQQGGRDAQGGGED